MAEPGPAMRLILWLVLTSGIAIGQERLQFYTTDNGLPSNAVLAILQSRDGYLWMTTRGGLVRFDGVRFQVFDESNTPAIHSANFAAFSLMEDRQGAIWAGSWNGAIRYQNGIFTSFSTRDGLLSNRVLRIDEDAQGTIWFFCEGGLSRLRDGRLESVGTIGGEPVEPYFEKPPNVAGDNYAFGLVRLDPRGAGLQRFAYGRWNDMPLPAGERNPATVRIELTAEDSHHRLWYRILNRPRESFCVQDGHLTEFHGLPTGAFASYQDRFGRVWITDADGHTAVWNAGRAIPLAGLSTASAMRVLEDREGGIWVGTLNQGVAHAPIPVFQSTRLPGGPEANSVKAIIQDPEGDIWIASRGITRIRSGRQKSFLLPHRMAPWPGDQMVSSLWAESDGSILLSTNNGLKVFRDGAFHLPEEKPLEQLRDRFNTMIRDRAGNLWLGSSGGIYRYRNGNLTRLQADHGLPLRGDVRTLAEDRNGTVWVGTDAVLCRVQNGELSCFGPSDPLYFWRIRTIMVDRDNVVWVGSTDRGLLRIEGENFRWIQAKDGLPRNSAVCILEDGQGYFWIGSPRGVYRVSKRELNDLAHGRAARVVGGYFGKSDGLNASDAGGNGQPSGLVARDGTLWFPTSDGLAKVDPAMTAVDQTPPRVQIDSCLVEHRPTACEREISLSAGESNLEISYTALNLVRSDQTQFRYRLEGLDPDWINAGSRRTAYYSHLGPGTYRFRVSGANAFASWGEASTVLKVIVQPRYYQTWPFECFAVASVIGIFVLMWWWRGAHYQRRQAQQRAFAQQVIASQETERKRIAAELHDGLGQRLTVIKNMALLLNRPGSKSEHQIEAITAETSQAIAEVRSITRNLRPYQLDLLGLTKAIEVLVKHSCEAAGVHADVVVDELSGGFRKDAEIHFYRIVQECLGNAIRHAQATTITVLVQRTDAGVSLTLSDNGAGFVPGGADGTAAKAGFGLTGISERAMILGGKALIRSAPGQGTTITIEIPADAIDSHHNGVWERV